MSPLTLLFSLLLIFTLIEGTDARAEKEQGYSTDEDYLPLGAELDEKEKEAGSAFLKDDSLLKDAVIKGIKIIKGESRVVFTIEAAGPASIAGKDLKFETVAVNFPPRVILRIYGVKSPESVFRFFKNLDIIGIVSNPFVQEYLSEYVIFFKDWVSVSGAFSREEAKLVLGYEFKNPEFRKGYGVRIADTKIDPLLQTVAIRNELKRNKLQSYLLIASDYETVVLESPFYRAKDEAVAYMEMLEKVGYKGKLAIRNYADFPEPLRIDVVSEVVVTGEDTVNLKNVVYTELTPQVVHPLGYSDIYTITEDLFSVQVQNNENAMAEYYYKLGEIYRTYAAEDENTRRLALKVAVKILEIIVFKFPKSEKADKALWGMANLIREHGVKDLISEEQCYKKIVDEYPNSGHRAEAQKRLAFLKRPSSPSPDKKGGKGM
jgi:hypothetical protein